MTDFRPTVWECRPCRRRLTVLCICVTAPFVAASVLIDSTLSGWTAMLAAIPLGLAFGAVGGMIAIRVAHRVVERRHQRHHEVAR